MFVIPSIFTAIDRISAPLAKITASANRFSGALKTANSYIGVSETGLARQERIFRRLTPTIGETGKQMLQYAKSAAVAGGILATAKFSFDQITAYEDALASFRTIVADLSDRQFMKFTDEIARVAKVTRRSSVEVAASFENIAGLNAKLAETADGLGKVSEASILLAKAGRLELGSAAENLVSIMNQYNLGAEAADRVTNVLAAGLNVGAARIDQAAESYKNFGSVAAAANITLEQSQALIQLVSQKGILGAEAGTKLRGSVLKLQQAGVGYKSGQFQIIDALEETQKRLDKVRTAKERDAILTKMFGAENITAGLILVNNISKFKEFTDAVSNTSAAQASAAINSNTLSTKISELKNRWATYITTNNKANVGLEKLKNILGFVTDNFDKIVSVGIDVIKFFAAWKGLLLTSRAILFVYNSYLGINAALNGASALAVGGNTIALGAYNIATKAAAAAQWLLNAALNANPIGLVVVAIAALVGLTYAIIKNWNTWGETVTLFLGPLGLVINLIQSFRRNWDMIKKSFKEGGIVGGLIAIGKTLLDAVLAPLQKILEIIGKLPGKFGELARSGAASLQAFRTNMGVVLKNDDGNGTESEPLPLLNPKAVQQQSILNTVQTINNNSQATINIKDETGRASVTSNTGVPITMTPTTQGYKPRR